jgi:hypothetical protein
LLRQGGEVAHDEVAQQIFEADAFEELVVLYLEVTPDVEKAFGSVIDKDLRDLFH